MAKAEASAEIPADQAERMLGLAVGAKGALDAVSARGTAPGATVSDRSAAAGSRECLDALAGLAAPFDQVVAELRAAVLGARPARVTASQARAVDEYAACARRFSGGAPEPPAPARGGWLEAIVGIGVPAAAAAAAAM